MFPDRSPTLSFTPVLRALRPAHVAAGLVAFALAVNTPDAEAAQPRPSDTVLDAAQHDQSQVLDALRERIKELDRQVDDLTAKQDRLTRELRELTEAFAETAMAYRNLDGSIDRNERNLGPATFVLSGDRLGNPTHLKLDRELVLGLCGDAEGCLVELGLDGVVIGGEEVETRFARGPCSFHIDGKTGAWALSGLCSEADLPDPAEDVGADTVRPVWGRSGDAGPIGGTEQDGRIILGFGGACFLAEAAPERRRVTEPEPRFQRDTARDLYLVAAGARWNPKGDFPKRLLPLGLSDPLFHCRLTLRD
jgi:hypothetical protein